MKRLLPILTLLFVFILTPFASATTPLGLTQSEVDRLSGDGQEGMGDKTKFAIDYRLFAGGSLDQRHKPTAQFQLKLQNSEGDVLQTVKSPSGRDLEVPTPKLNYSTYIRDTVKNKVIIEDLSSPYTGRTINMYDIQHRFVPEGKNRADYPIHSYDPTKVTSWSRVQQIIDDAINSVNENGTLEIYLAVSDKGEPYNNLPNWSANGNVAVLDTTKPNLYPKGMIWYFTGVEVELSTEAPDFFPTPEGETEWKETFKESAKTYTGKPGEQITFPVNLYNTGEKAITNFRAVWEGQGSDSQKGWAGSNPPWKTDTIELEKNGKQTFNVTIPFPSAGKPNKLYFMANIDGNTPANETNKDNNIMAIVFKKPGVDLAIAGKPQSAIVKLPQTSTQMAGVVLYTITRKDGGADPVQATLTMNGPSGAKTETIAVTDKPLTRSYVHKTNKPGTYSFSAEVWPITETEVYPPDNKTQTSIQFTRDAIPDPGKQDEDKNLEVGLTG